MTPEILNLIITTYGPPAGIVAGLFWWIKNNPSKGDPTKALFDKLDRIENDVSALRSEVKQMDQRDDAMHDRLLRLETRDEMRGK